MNTNVWGKVMKLIKQGKLGYSLTNTSANLSVIGAFQIVEDAITEMMGILKLDGETCVPKYDAMWVFAKNRIEMRSPLHWLDEYTVECAITNASGVKLIVDTVIKSHNKIAVASRAELCAIDHHTGRVRRANTAGVDENIEKETPEIDVEFHNANFEPNELVYSVCIGASAIDFYHHTNNIAYVQYVINQFNAEYPISAFEIRYINQTFQGDKLEVYKCDDNKFTIHTKDKTVVNCIVEQGAE